MKIFTIAIFGFLLFSGLVWCQEDKLDEEGEVEDEDAAGAGGEAGGDVTGGDKDLEPEEETFSLKPSPDADTYALFTKPDHGRKELPAGPTARILVSMFNAGDKQFTVDSVHASFYYPADYNFQIRNYTASSFAREVPPQTEATFDYAFMPAEDLMGRPFGLVVLLTYRDDQKMYQSAVFNETVEIVEVESTFNPETGFLYVLFACIVVILLVVGQHFLQKMRRKHGLGGGKSKSYSSGGVPLGPNGQPLEMGTGAAGDVDWEWIPKETVMRAAKKTTQKPVRQRKPGSGKSSGGSDED